MINKQLNTFEIAVIKISLFWSMSAWIEQHAMDIAGKIKEIASKFEIGFIYKTSWCGERASLKGKGRLMHRTVLIR